MSGGRVAWIIWCLAWTGFWGFAGFATLGLAWVMVPLSLLAILLPVGRERTESCVVCQGTFPASNMALHMQIRHPQPWPRP